MLGLAVVQGVMKNFGGHSQVMALADKVIVTVKFGAIKRFNVMGECDGRILKITVPIFFTADSGNNFIL